LTAGYPEELLDARGCFPGVVRLFFRSVLPVSRGVLAAVRSELEAQIELLLDGGAPLGHLNGHQYIECLPLVSQVVPQLAERYSLRAVRVAWEPGLSRLVVREGRPVDWALAQIKRLFAFHWRLEAARRRLSAADCYFGTAHAGAISLKVLNAYLNAASGDFVEVGLHPGKRRAARRLTALHPSTEDAAAPEVDAWFDSIADGRPGEFEMLCSTELALGIVAAGFHLGRLSQLGESAAARRAEAA
jgi:predicted glycoside hydrolase/deacetylase ChbG (UPF0249 family)